MSGNEQLAEAARRRAELERRWKAEGGDSLARRLAQIGVLGWLIVTPTLGGLFLGRWIDRSLGSGIFWSAPLLMLGVGLGGWLGWRWMRQQ